MALKRGLPPRWAKLAARRRHSYSSSEAAWQGVTVRKATVADIDGLVASITGLFAEDSVRDKLRNPGWPQAHAPQAMKPRTWPTRTCLPWLKLNLTGLSSGI